MNRSIEIWRACSPHAMATSQSAKAREFAFADAQHDILELHDKAKNLAEILRAIAYPRRGTSEEHMDIQGFADLIQARYTSEQLQCLGGSL